METLKQIGGKITNTGEECKKEELDEDKQYVVYANINSSEEDFSFLITALYHWETMYPSFTLELPKDPEEIVVKKKKEEEKKEEEKKEEGKVEDKKEGEGEKKSDEDKASID
jgi:hypothetical protein